MTRPAHMAALPRARRRILALLVALLAIVLAAPADGKKPKPKPKGAGKKPATAEAPRPRNEAPRGETALDQELQDELDRLLSTRPLARASNGVLVIDLSTGKVLYSYNADRQLKPASNIKLVATAAALDALGPDFTFRTRVLGPEPDGAGVVRGDVWLVGMTDPTLEVEHLGELARALRARGIRRVEGDLVVGTAEGRDAVVRPRVAITVVGGDREGDLASVRVEPDSAYFVIDNEALTGKPSILAPRPAPAKKGKRKGLRRRTPVSTVKITLEERRDERGEHVLVRVSGKLGPGQRATAVRNVPRPALFTAHTLRAQMLRAGVDMTGGVRRVEAPPDGLAELAAHESLPLAWLCAMVNKPSWNWLADRVIEATGAQLYGGEPTNAKGLRAMAAFLAKLGVARGSYVLENGSGLSHASFMSARQVAAVLLYGWHEFRIAPDFVASLAVGGRDGTLRGRFRNAARGWVRAKTGTLNGVSALSGYVSAGDGSVLLFAILNNGFPTRRMKQIRAGQGAMVDAMFRFLRRRAAAGQPTEGPFGAPPDAPIALPDGLGEEEELVPDAEGPPEEPDQAPVDLLEDVTEPTAEPDATVP